MLTLRTYATVFLLSFLCLAGCQQEDLRYNHWKCTTGVEGKGLLAMKMEGEEEKLKSLLTVLKMELGNPKVTFLHYTLESYAEFFKPNARAINPKFISSPFGIQKILVWDSLRWPELSEDTVQVSLQVEERRRGKRPIDPYDCELELRVRTRSGKDMLGDCDAGSKVQDLAGRLIRRFVGAPHGGAENPEFAEVEAHYEARKEAYAARVGEVLDPACYPAINLNLARNAMTLRICEQEGMRDTLNGTVEVLDVNGDHLPYILYDLVEEGMAEGVRIMDGLSGYQILVGNVREIGEIRFLLSDGRVIIYYEIGDYFGNGSPYKPRWDQEQYKRRREERIRERVKENEEIKS